MKREDFSKVFEIFHAKIDKLDTDYENGVEEFDKAMDVCMSLLAICEVFAENMPDEVLDAIDIKWE